MVEVIRRIGVLVAAASLLAACTGPPSTAPSAAAAGLVAPSGATTEITTTTESASLEDRLTAGMDVLLSRQSRYPRLLRSVEISVGGTTVFEYRQPGLADDDAVNIFSVTKSVTSALVGIAIGEQLISGVDATLEDLLPQYADAMPPAVRAITLENLLTMTGGFGDLPDDLLQSGDWVGSILASPAAGPDEPFQYSDATSHLLSAIVSTASGMPTVEYAQPRLLAPLGIPLSPLAEPLPTDSAEAFDAAYEATSGVIWPADPQEYATGFSLLTLTSEHLMQFGKLYLASGVWEGAQIVPADWVAESTRPHVEQAAPERGYGYQWWTLDVHGHVAFAAVGFAGQMVEVLPDLDAVVVASSDWADFPINAAELLDEINLDLVRELG